jgi:hypothetical protein
MKSPFWLCVCVTIHVSFLCAVHINSECYNRPKYLDSKIHAVYGALKDSTKNDQMLHLLSLEMNDF